MLDFIKKLFTGKVDFNYVSGPVGIVKEMGSSVNSGLATVINYIAFISLNLGIMNLLPIPALDGGRILFILIEAVANIEFPPAVSGIAIWAAWFVTVGKKQIEFVHNEVNDDYDKKGWGKPIGLTLLGLLAYVAALIAFSFLLVIAGVMQLPA